MKIKLLLLLVLTVYAGWETGSSAFYDLPEDSSGSDFNSEKGGLDIFHYDLELKIDLKNLLLFGTAKLKGTFGGESASIDLNFYDNMKITDLKFNGERLEYLHRNNLISINPPSPKDTFLIEISYEGKPKRAGLSGFVFGERKGNSVVYNLNEPDFASTWFPCNDIPSDKAMLDIKISSDSSKVSVSNGILIDTYNAEEGLKTYHWRTLYPVSTYLVCLYSGNYKNFSDEYISQDGKDTMKIEYYVFEDHLENARKDFEDHLKMMNYFSKTFGEYPFIKEKYGVAEFLWQFGAMEHQTMTGIGSNFITGKKYFNDVYVHELAHHWWGNAVGPATWKDIWLNEGFSTYSEALYEEHIDGKKALQAVMMSKFNENLSGALYDPGGNLFNSTVYDKGAWVLHMLRRETGDTIFFNILSQYFEKYKYSTASTKDLQNICEEIIGRDLDQFFRQWVIEGDDIIKLDFSWKAEKINEKYIIKLNFKQTQQGFDEYKFPLDIEFRLEGGEVKRETFFIDKRNKIIEYELDGRPVEAAADPDSWLLAIINVIK